MGAEVSNLIWASLHHTLKLPGKTAKDNLDPGVPIISALMNVNIIEIK